MKYINAALMGGFFSLVVSPHLSPSTSQSRQTKKETKSRQVGAPAITNDNIFGGPMSKYDITDIIWEVPINPERNITVVGTIEDVIHHLQQVAPEIAEAKFPSVPRSESTSVLLSSAGASINTPAPNKVTCGISDHTASFAQIMVGVRYLRLLRNGPGMGPVCHSSSLNFSDV